VSVRLPDVSSTGKNVFVRLPNVFVRLADDIDCLIFVFVCPTFGHGSLADVFVRLLNVFFSLRNVVFLPDEYVREPDDDVFLAHEYVSQPDEHVREADEYVRETDEHVFGTDEHVSEADEYVREGDQYVSQGDEYVGATTDVPNDCRGTNRVLNPPSAWRSRIASGRGGPHMTKPLDVLLIEDVPRDAENIEEELKEARAPFALRRIDTWSGFLAELQRRLPDIVLSDFTLHGFSALDALHHLRKNHPEIPFILVTGNRSEEVAVECIREGADDYILKASLKRLPTSINNAIQKKAVEQARARAELALRRSEEQYRLIAEHTRDLISLVGVDGKFLYASRGYERSLGYKPEELLGTDPLALVHPEDRETVRVAWQQAREHRESRTAEFRMQHRAGEWRFFESAGNWIFDEHERPHRLAIVSRDTTRRKVAETALRELPRLIREAQEAERRRVARELHDSVNQILSSVKFRLQSIEGKLDAGTVVEPGDVLQAKVYLEKAIQEVRRISRNLRPSELDDLGLMPALRSLCSEFTERTGVAIDLKTARLPQGLPADLELNLYRIVQEALGNVEKHARATEAVLHLVRDGTVVRVVLRDNGRGFDPAQPRGRKRKGQGPGMGLVDMQERAAFMGGTCSLNSSPGEGTEIVIEMPLRMIDNSRVKTQAAN
jgi:two-component system, NarL family, sensor histidine kinase UhpB